MKWISDIPYPRIVAATGLVLGGVAGLLLWPPYMSWATGSAEQNYGLSIAPDPLTVLIRVSAPIVGALILILILQMRGRDVTPEDPAECPQNYDERPDHLMRYVVSKGYVRKNPSWRWRK